MPRLHVFAQYTCASHAKIVVIVSLRYASRLFSAI